MYGCGVGTSMARKHGQQLSKHLYAVREERGNMGDDERTVDSKVEASILGHNLLCCWRKVY